MKKKVSLHWAILGGLLFAVVAVIVTCLVFMGVFGGESFSLSWKYREALARIEDNYVGDLDLEDAVDQSMDALIAALGDRWSYYMTAEDYQSYLDNSNNQYTGMGITITANEGGGLLIAGVYADSPAADAGLEAGDVIVGVNGQDITDLSYEEATAAIPSGGETAIQLDIRRADGTEESVEITPRAIYVNPVSYELLEGDVGYISLSNFEIGSADEVIAAIEALQGQGAQSLMVDVRNNPGGKLSELQDLLDYLLPEGDIFISQDKAGNETVTRSDADCLEIPMVVLVNENTYSAAEFFAAALEEYDWAEIVGSHTTGKGRSQSTYRLSDGSAIHISTREYFTPNGVSLSEVGGIAPDVEVDMTDEEFSLLYYGQLSLEEDPQVQAALELLA